MTGGSGTPTGTVTFTDGGSTLGSATLNGSGQASLATSGLGAGSHSIIATYGGNTTYNGSSSGAVTLTVKHATSTSLEVTDDGPRLGDEVTFTATVTSGGGTPTGTVSFYDGGDLIGSQALDGSGRASLATSGLGIGSHTIAADYEGNTTFDLSSDSLVVAVDQWPEVSFSPPNPTTDDAVTVTVWVDCAAGAPNILPSFYYYVPAGDAQQLLLDDPLGREPGHRDHHLSPPVTSPPAPTACPATDETPASTRATAFPPPTTSPSQRPSPWR